MKQIALLLLIALLATGCASEYYRFFSDRSSPPYIGYYEFCMYRPLADRPVLVTYWVMEKWKHIEIDEWDYPLSECKGLQD